MEQENSRYSRALFIPEIERFISLHCSLGIYCCKYCRRKISYGETYYSTGKEWYDAVDNNQHEHICKLCIINLKEHKIFLSSYSIKLRRKEIERLQFIEKIKKQEILDHNREMNIKIIQNPKVSMMRKRLAIYRLYRFLDIVYFDEVFSKEQSRTIFGQVYRILCLSSNSCDLRKFLLE
jgi:hypothetical protein